MIECDPERRPYVAAFYQNFMLRALYPLRAFGNRLSEPPWPRQSVAATAKPRISNSLTT